MHDQTEDALRQHLGRVTAPPELWERVQSASPRAGAPRFPMAWAAVAVVLVMAVAGWSVWKTGARPIKIQTASASEVHNWVLANSGLDVPLPARPGSLVEILGASIDRAVATISYRVGELRATLSVAKDASGDAPHTGTEISSTWTMGGQSYTIAVSGPGDLHAACLLCHNAREAALY
jgi:hypothetical protein